MGKDSSIEWTDHTFNPWWGCAKVSPACEHCYAEAWANRVGQAVWGKSKRRRFFGEKHWAEPGRWNERAATSDRRARVFCASMADVFEMRKDLDPARARLWGTIESTPHLDWLLLTKRPENVSSMVPWGNTWPRNVWLGTTVENQELAKRRIPTLLKAHARVRFLSCEPLLGSVDLSQWIRSGLHWVIAGGESGHSARPMLPAWARTLRDQCRQAEIPFHFKQWGHWAPKARPTKSDRLHGRQFFDEVSGEEFLMHPEGKKAAGRVLDGKTWDELPASP